MGLRAMIYVSSFIDIDSISQNLTVGIHRYTAWRSKRLTFIFPNAESRLQMLQTGIFLNRRSKAAPPCKETISGIRKVQDYWPQYLQTVYHYVNKETIL
jgi:hypothetical protein